MDNKLPLAKILVDAGRYCHANLLDIGIFAALNYVVCTAAAYSWKTVYFWPSLLLMYVLWGTLFRYYFRREPYWAWRPIFASTVPSTKILVLSVLVVSALVLLPWLPLFLPIASSEFIDSYSRFLQQHFQERDVLDVVINLVVVILSPVIFYRPMFAWISSLIGRSGLLKSAYEKTRGNYWEFLLLSVVVNLLMSLIYFMATLWSLPLWTTVLPLSLLAVYFNIVLAEAYSFFFLQVDNV